LAPISSSISRWAAKPIISRSTSASALFSTSALKSIMTSVIFGSLVRVDVRNPTLPKNRR
jgi:hypothetical protein